MRKYSHFYIDSRRVDPVGPLSAEADQPGVRSGLGHHFAGFDR